MTAEKPRPPAGRVQRTGDLLLAAAVAAAIVAVALIADGGLRLENTTSVEIALVGGGALLSTAAMLRHAGQRLYGAWPLAGLAALAALTGLSIIWSIAPAESYEETNRTLAYLCVFAAGLALARLAGQRWAAVLGGIALGCVAVSSCALATKVLPAELAEGEVYARLREPFGYWNAVGLMAALGMPPLLWVAARRTGRRALSALAWPGMTVLLVALMLAYSRGALLALLAGLAFWFVAVPLRLRSIVALLASAAGAALVTAWTFAQDSLSRDGVPLAARVDAGQELGLLLAFVLLALLGAGLALTFLADRNPPSPRARRTAGAALIAMLALVPVGILIALAAAPGGVDGQVTKAWNQLTDPAASTPANTPDRLKATSSVRARYWDEAFKVHAESPVVGVGAGAYVTGRTRFRTESLEVRHAHGYVAQTLADLGWTGLGVSLAALVAWLISAGRATGLWPGLRRRPFTPERIGLLAMVAVALVFGVHSAIDWTWFVPANAGVALLCAGWVAGRGPLGGRRAGTRAPRRRAVLLGAGLVLAVAVAAAWAAYQPIRALHAGDQAIAAAEAGDDQRAAALARDAAALNPLSVEPLWELAAIERSRGRTRAALRALEGAVRRQPASAEAWRRLGRLRLAQGRLDGALTALRAAYALDPSSPAAASDLLEALRAQDAASAPAP